MNQPNIRRLTDKPTVTNAGRAYSVWLMARAGEFWLRNDCNQRPVSRPSLAGRSAVDPRCLD